MSNNDDVKNPSYNYTKIVKEPTEMGVSSDKGVENYERDFASMVKYVELLSSGDSGKDSASNLKDGQTIGDSYFLASSLECKNKKPRYFYVDNTTSTDSILLSTIESIEQLGEEIPKMFSVFGEIGPVDCELSSKDIVSQNVDGSNSISEEEQYMKKESFSIFKKSSKDKIPHFYVLTVGLFFTYVLFNLSLKK